MSIGKHFSGNDETTAINVYKLSLIGVADLRDVCDRHHLPVRIDVMLPGTKQEFIQVVAPHAQMLQFVFYLFNNEFNYKYELGSTP
jgi:hypothetical protein